MRQGHCKNDGSQCGRGPVAPQSSSPRWPGLLLLVAVIIEFLTGLADLPILLGNLSEIPGPGLGGAIIIAKIALQPVLALAALFFLIRGYLPYALLTMAAIILMTWLNFLPSADAQSLDLRASGGGGVYLFFLIVLQPFSSSPLQPWR